MTVPFALTTDVVLQSVVDAIALGSLFALYALAIALIFGIMGLVNFAHGELIMVGGLTLALLAGHVPIVVLLLVLAVVVAAFALAMERVAFRPVRGATPATLLVTSFAVSFVLQNLAILVFGATPRTVDIGGPLAKLSHIGGVAVSRLDVVIVATTGALLVALALFLSRTLLGIQMRAAAENFDMARLLGVRANMVIGAAFAISGLLAAGAAYFLVAQTGVVTPQFGAMAVLFGFIATILGGMGSLTGAVAGGFVLGAVTVTLQTALPLEIRSYRDAFVFAIVFAILVVRPDGLVARRTRV